jgi:hypothetical protein
MKQELIYIIDKIEHISCKTHSEKAEIKIISGNIQIKCCCEKHKRFLEGLIDYELYELFNQEEEQLTEALLPLKYAV